MQETPTIRSSGLVTVGQHRRRLVRLGSNMYKEAADHDPQALEAVASVLSALSETQFRSDDAEAVAALVRGFSGAWLRSTGGRHWERWHEEDENQAAELEAANTTSG